RAGGGRPARARRRAALARAAGRGAAAARARRVGRRRALAARGAAAALRVARGRPRPARAGGVSVTSAVVLVVTGAVAGVRGDRDERRRSGRAVLLRGTALLGGA